MEKILQVNFMILQNKEINPLSKYEKNEIKISPNLLNLEQLDYFIEQIFEVWSIEELNYRFKTKTMFLTIILNNQFIQQYFENYLDFKRLRKILLIPYFEGKINKI